MKNNYFPLSKLPHQSFNCVDNTRLIIFFSLIFYVLGILPPSLQQRHEKESKVCVGPPTFDFFSRIHS